MCNIYLGIMYRYRYLTFLIKFEWYWYWYLRSGILSVLIVWSPSVLIVLSPPQVSARRARGALALDAVLYQLYPYDWGVHVQSVVFALCNDTNMLMLGSY